MTGSAGENEDRASPGQAGTGAFAVAATRDQTPDQPVGRHKQPTRRKTTGLSLPQVLPPSSEATGWVPVQECIDSFEWSRTCLGPRHEWPFAASSSLSLCISLQIPCALYLSPEEMIMVWNDAYRAVAGEKHPTKVR